MAKLIAIIVLLNVLAIFGAFNPPVYKQYDSRWSDIILGFGPDTIGHSGCLMTSVTSMAAGYGIKINGSIPDPIIMNEWLKENGGFVSGDLFVWDSVKPLGLVWQGFVFDPFTAINLMKQGYNVILNVLGGHHYVLALAPNEVGFDVMDPGYIKTSYTFQDVVRYSYYKYVGPTTNEEEEGSEEYYF